MSAVEKRKDYADTVEKESEGSFDEKAIVPDIVCSLLLLRSTRY